MVWHKLRKLNKSEGSITVKTSQLYSERRLKNTVKGQNSVISRNQHIGLLGDRSHYMERVCSTYAPDL